MIDMKLILMLFAFLFCLPLQLAAATYVWDTPIQMDYNGRYTYDDDGCGGSPAGSISINGMTLLLYLESKTYFVSVDGFPPQTSVLTVHGDTGAPDWGQLYTFESSPNSLIERSDFNNVGAERLNRPTEESMRFYIGALLDFDPWSTGKDELVGYMAFTMTDDAYVTLEYAEFTDESSIIVRAVPEPTSGILTLVGSTLLLLLRRKFS
jgi:hypothetical protein